MGMAAASDRMHGPIPRDEEPVTEHSFYQTRLTGNWICSGCGLLPLDGSDYETDCMPEPDEPDYDSSEDGWYGEEVEN